MLGSSFLYCLLKTMKLINKCVICYFHHPKSVLNDVILKEYINSVIFIKLKYIKLKFYWLNWLPLKCML